MYILSTYNHIRILEDSTSNIGLVYIGTATIIAYWSMALFFVVGYYVYLHVSAHYCTSKFICIYTESFTYYNVCNCNFTLQSTLEIPQNCCK